MIDISDLTENQQAVIKDIAMKYFLENEFGKPAFSPPPKPKNNKIKMNRNKNKRLPMSKIEAWAVFILIGFLIILWAYVEIKNTVSDKHGTQQRTTMMMNNSKMPQRAK